MYDDFEDFGRPKAECLRCGESWVPRLKKTPIRCPKCGSPYWNLPRTQEHKPRKAKATP